MGLADRVRGLWGGAPRIRVHLYLSGRVGLGWQSVDRMVSLRVGATLADLFDAAERDGIDLRAAIAESPHLRHTLMHNGERCPVDENLGRALADGDQIYLLAPIAGG